MNKSKTKQGTCPGCGDKTLIRDSQTGEIACTLCGMVLEEELELSDKQEWRAYTQEEWEKRSRAAPKLGQSTQIGDEYGSRGIRKFPSSKMKRLKKQDYRTRIDAKTKHLNRAKNELDRLSDKLHIPKHIRELSKQLYQQVLDKNAVRGRTVEAVAAAVLYLACRKSFIPRKLSRFAQHSPFDKKEITRIYRFLLRKLDIKISRPGYPQALESVLGMLQVSEKTRRKSFEILTEVQKRKIVAGKNPWGIAAAVTYIACEITNEKITQIEIAYVADVTDVTIRNRYPEIKEKLNIQ